MKNDLKNPATWIPKETFLAYAADRKPEKLARFYDKAAAKKNMVTSSWSWLAFLFLPAWFGYRRQWALWGVFMGLIALICVFEAFSGYVVPNAAFFGMTMVFSMQANGLLLSMAHLRYQKLKQEGVDDSGILEKMRGQAQGSVGLAIAAALLYVVIILGFYFLMDILIPPPETPV